VEYLETEGGWITKLQAAEKFFMPAYSVTKRIKGHPEARIAVKSGKGYRILINGNNPVFIDMRGERPRDIAEMASFPAEAVVYESKCRVQRHLS
jgi:hypothetical protein